MTLDEKLSALAAEFGGDPWGVALNMPRIYFNLRLLHAKVFFDFPKAANNNLGVPVLRVQHQRPGRPYPLRKRIVASEYRELVVAARAWMQAHKIA